MNIYCFSTLSFAKLQFKSVINKAFHKHGVASFTDAWIETILREGVYTEIWSHLLQMRGLKPSSSTIAVLTVVASFTDAWIETTLILEPGVAIEVASFTDAWIETDWLPSPGGIAKVASFTDAWIETFAYFVEGLYGFVASFTDAWIETCKKRIV